ncbi:hypothetical protein [Treponema berlinense]|uniref:hypothetical protein n=1 Tax=Treponema berlinense TaxID=225004 RepID=UPI003FD856CD
MAEKKENLENKKSELPKEKTQEKTKVKILEVLRGTYGAFNPGETVELEPKLAEAFIKSGFAEKN